MTTDDFVEYTALEAFYLYTEIPINLIKFCFNLLKTWCQEFKIKIN